MIKEQTSTVIKKSNNIMNKCYLIVKTIGLTKEYYWYSDYMLTLDASKGDLYSNEESLLILKKNPKLKRMIVEKVGA